MNHPTIRYAQERDIPKILYFIKELAVYENMLDDVMATEDLLREWIFEKQKAEVLLAEEDGISIGFALFFHNFSTFLGRAGIYLEDLFVMPEHRGKGCGKALLQRLAQITVERGCGKTTQKYAEKSCLNSKTTNEFYAIFRQDIVASGLASSIFQHSIQFQRATSQLSQASHKPILSSENL